MLLANGPSVFLHFDYRDKALSSEVERKDVPVHLVCSGGVTCERGRGVYPCSRNDIRGRG